MATKQRGEGGVNYVLDGEIRHLTSLLSRSGRKVQSFDFAVVMATWLLGGGCHIIVAGWSVVVKQLLPGYVDGVGDGQLARGDGIRQNEKVVLKK